MTKGKKISFKPLLTSAWTMTMFFFFNDDYFKLINLNKHLEQQLYLIYNVCSHFIKARF